jgi:hypothetical protein
MYSNSLHSRFGLTVATAATQAITAIPFGVSGLDPATYLGVIACGLPAWRAAQVDLAST